MNVEKTKVSLMYVYVVPLSCWMFDVITTYYAIDYLGVAGEMNPLGWPLGALGALVFYIPAILFTYVLLFRIRNSYSSWAALLITILALGAGVLNLLAAMHNINVMEAYTGRSTLLYGITEFLNSIVGQVLFWIMISALTFLVIKEATARIMQKL